MKRVKKKKVILVFIVTLFVLALAGLLVVKSGIFVRPTARSLSKLTEIPQYDVLTWQQNREAMILADYQTGTYPLAEPYIIIDPYEMNPLSALVLFEPNGAKNITVTVQGDDDNSTLTYNKTVSGNLTIKDKTVNVSFPAKVEVTENGLTLVSNFTINRQDWGLAYGTEGDPKDWMISQEVDLELNVVAGK